MLSREVAEPFVLAILAGLSVIGVFSLFAGAVGILHFGEKSRGGEIARSFLDNMNEGALVTSADGSILYANDAYRQLMGVGEDDSVITVERAVDPAHVPLVAFGGAGGLHAVGLARRLGMPCAIVPDHPGALSAVGLALAGESAEHARPVMQLLSSLSDRVLRVEEGGRGALERVYQSLVEGEATPDVGYVLSLNRP